MSAVTAQPPAGRRPPWLGEHTAGVLAAELGLSSTQIQALREAGVIA
jgi:crotonobetainyl-CoA:carnitine CoA-transferase CaiB-like acyl-CoA transferase